MEDMTATEWDLARNDFVKVTTLPAILGIYLRRDSRRGGQTEPTKRRYIENAIEYANFTTEALYGERPEETNI